MGESGVDSFSIDAMIRGYHVYQEIWDPFLGEELTCQRETVNRQDPFAVALVRSTPVRTVVGHVPRKISSVCSMFWLGAGEFTVELAELGVTQCMVYRVWKIFAGFIFVDESKSAKSAKLWRLKNSALYGIDKVKTEGSVAQLTLLYICIYTLNSGTSSLIVT